VVMRDVVTGVVLMRGSFRDASVEYPSSSARRESACRVEVGLRSWLPRFARCVRFARSDG
jgi:hypothetical protein